VGEEKQVRMAAKMYEMRDACRSFLGDVYPERMKEYGEALTNVSKATGRSVLSIATDAAKEASPFGIITLMAAVVELTEPSAAASIGAKMGEE
jgi:hypothetical protein